jgi:hypothetical protein
MMKSGKEVVEMSDEMQRDDGAKTVTAAVAQPPQFDLVRAVDEGLERDRSNKVLERSDKVPAGRLLSRRQAAKLLTELGLPISAGTLAVYVTTGGGPLYRKWGHTPVYEEEDLLSWAREKLGPKRKSARVVDATLPVHWNAETVTVAKLRVADPAKGADLDLDLGLGD